MKPRWHIYPDTNDLVDHTISAITRIANHAIIKHGAFHLVLAGGSTPKIVYERLRDASTRWSAWHIYFGDERCLPANDLERNSVMAFDALLHHVPIPAQQIHVIPAELGPEAGSRAYAKTIEGISRFDLVLLGLGEDGHTASLFPGNNWGVGMKSDAALAVYNSPKLPKERITLSVHRFNTAEQVIFLVTGLSKQNAIADWFGGKLLPAASITPVNGVDVFMEAICFPS